MVVGPGDRLATDGVIRQGRSTLDLAAITGESVPVEVGAGAEVFAASINGGGVLDVEVTARTTDSSLARVVHIVEEAQERKGSSQRLAERVARPLVPGIMVVRSEEHTSELQSLMRISYAVFCLKKKTNSQLQ